MKKKAKIKPRSFRVSKRRCTSLLKVEERERVQGPRSRRERDQAFKIKRDFNLFLKEVRGCIYRWEKEVQPWQSYQNTPGSNHYKKP